MNNGKISWKKLLTRSFQLDVNINYCLGMNALLGIPVTALRRDDYKTGILDYKGHLVYYGGLIPFLPTKPVSLGQQVWFPGDWHTKPWRRPGDWEKTVTHELCHARQWRRHVFGLPQMTFIQHINEVVRKRGSMEYEARFVGENWEQYRDYYGIYGENTLFFIF